MARLFSCRKCKRDNLLADEILGTLHVHIYARSVIEIIKESICKDILKLVL